MQVSLFRLTPWVPELVGSTWLVLLADTFWVWTTRYAMLRKTS